MQVPPSIELAGLIRHYLFLDVADASTRKLRLFSDGSTGILFNSQAHLLWDSISLPEAFFYGQITEYKELSCQGPAQLIIVVFHPHGFNRLLNMPASEGNDKVIPLADVFGIAGVALQDAVSAAHTPALKIDCIEGFLREMIRHNRPVADLLVMAALSLIRQNKGSIRIHQLTGLIGCQPRQLERKFNAVVGLSPKHFCTVVRTVHFIRSLQGTTTRPNLTGTAYDSGYYDQAHLIREFRKLTGLTPSQYLRHSDPLAVNLLQL